MSKTPTIAQLRAMQAATVAPIYATPGMRADHRATWAQIPVGARMNLGARDVLHDDENGILQFRIGSARVIRKAIIKLNGRDLYDIEIGRLTRPGYEWVTEATAEDVDAANLADALIRLHHQATS